MSRVPLEVLVVVSHDGIPWEKWGIDLDVPICLPIFNYIYLQLTCHLVDFNGKLVGKYNRPMDPGGMVIGSMGCFYYL